MRKLLLITTLSAVLGLFGCVGLDNRSFTGLKTTPTEVRLGSVLRLVRDTCPSEDQKSANLLGGSELLPVFASFGAQFAVDAISEAIKEYREGLTGFFTASSQYEKAVLDNKKTGLADPGCLVIARGLIGTSTNATSPKDAFDPTTVNDLHLADYPAFYLEAKISGYPSNLSLKPYYLTYAASSARSRGSGKKYVSVAVAVSGSTPKTGSDSTKIVTKDNSFAVTFLDFGRIEIGKHYDVTTLKGIDAQAAMKKADLDKVNLVSVTAVVTESEEPGWDSRPSSQRSTRTERVS